MSDLFGLSILVAISYYFLKSLNQKDRKSLFFAFFLLGILGGIRVSFLPFLFPFIVYLFIKNIRHVFYFILFYCLGILIWLIPLIIITDPTQLYNLALSDTSGHFNNWGGTVLSSDSSIIIRFYKTIESIWADGLGAWWPKRSWVTIASSLSVCLFIFNGLRGLKNKIKNKHYLIFACLVTYFIWILFFQNVIYKPRHIIPLLPFIIMLIDIGLQKSIKNNFGKIIFMIFCFSIIFSVGMLTYQHKYKTTAINQMKEAVTNYKAPQKAFYSSKLMTNYLDSHINEYGYLEKYHNSKKNYYKIINRYNENYIIFSTIKLDSNFFNLIDENIFFHNPYVNRLWSSVHLYVYSNSNSMAK
tara:strand:+ start:427 stop:1497 length:1071 start_codon:yes stop_codon:yes gene_type:complete